MNMNLLGAAAAAAMLGLSTASLAQTAGGAPGSTGASGTSNSSAGASSGSADNTTGSSTPGARSTTPDIGSAPISGSSIGAGSAAPSTSGVSARRCNALSGAEKVRCLREEGVPDTTGTGSMDRAGPGSTGMGSGAAR